jgi:membrane protease YdiL (CAAX protease family)
MRPLQWTLLLFIVVLGVLWIFLAQNVLFLNLFPGLLVGPGLDLQDYLQTGSSPSFAMLWISCMVALLIWFATTASGRPRSSAEVRRRRPLWWLAAAILVVLGWLYQLFFTVFRWQITGQSPIEGSGTNYYPLPPGGLDAAAGLSSCFDVLLLFWLPTLLASPRSYRFVVPGAVKLLGGR